VEQSAARIGRYAEGAVCNSWRRASGPHDGRASVQGFGGFDDLLGTGADPVVFREVDPANRAVGCHEELGGTSDVASVDSLSGVDEVVAADSVGVGVGKYGEGEAGFAREVARDVR
jgi:hypothetical protein